jgi:hypothetical protein
MGASQSLVSAPPVAHIACKMSSKATAHAFPCRSLSHCHIARARADDTCPSLLDVDSAIVRRSPIVHSLGKTSVTCRHLIHAACPSARVTNKCRGCVSSTTRARHRSFDSASRNSIGLPESDTRSLRNFTRANVLSNVLSSGVAGCRADAEK